MVLPEVLINKALECDAQISLEFDFLSKLADHNLKSSNQGLRISHLHSLWKNLAHWNFKYKHVEILKQQLLETHYGMNNWF